MKIIGLSILFVSLFSSTVWSDVTDFFGFKLGDNYKFVISLIDQTDPHQCWEKDKVPSSQFLYPVDFRVGRMFYPEEQTGIFSFLENQKVMTITNQVRDKNCEVETVEFMNFCLSTGELVLYQVRYPIDREWFGKFNPVFNDTEREFIGFTNDDELIDFQFKGQFVSFLVLNRTSGVIRKSWMTLMGNSPMVVHKIFKSPNDSDDFFNFGMSSLCPEGPDTISNFKPKYTSLERVMWVSRELVSRYEQTRRYYNKCVVLFPENKKKYDGFWESYRDLNEEDYQVIKNKADQILISLDNREMSDKFNSDSKRLLTRRLEVVDMFVGEEIKRDQSLKFCERTLGKLPKRVGETETGSFDPDFVKNISIK